MTIFMYSVTMNISKRYQ